MCISSICWSSYQCWTLQISRTHKVSQVLIKVLAIHTRYNSTSDIRQAVAKVVKFTGEPKSADIRRQSQKAITGLFALSPANFSRILSTLPKGDQDSANKILSTYMSELPSSGDESDRDTPSTPFTPRVKKTTPAKVSASSPYNAHPWGQRKCPNSNSHFRALDISNALTTGVVSPSSLYFHSLYYSNKHLHGRGLKPPPPESWTQLHPCPLVGLEA